MKATPNHKRQDEDTHFEVQMKRVFAAFQRKPSTMLMVSIETGILRANICRYVAKWQKHNRIQRIETGICEISKHRSGYYSTDKSLFNEYSKSN